jgi:hypothetical protein
MCSESKQLEVALQVKHDVKLQQDTTQHSTEQNKRG